MKHHLQNRLLIIDTLVSFQKMTQLMIVKSGKAQHCRGNVQGEGTVFKSSCHHYPHFSYLMVIFMACGMRVTSGGADIYPCVDWRLEDPV